MVGQSRFICLRSNLLQVKMFLNDRNWNNSIQILLHYKHVPSTMDWESVVVNCGNTSFWPECQRWDTALVKPYSCYLVPNPTWLAKDPHIFPQIPLQLYKSPMSQMSPGWRVQSGRRPEGRDTSMPMGPRMLAASWKKNHLPAKKYWNTLTMVLVLVIVAHTSMNLWVICDFTSIHTSQRKQINVSLGCPSILRIKLPTGSAKKIQKCLQVLIRRVGTGVRLILVADATTGQRVLPYFGNLWTLGDPLEITKQRVMHLLRNGWCWHDLACSCQTNKAHHVPEVRHAQLDSCWILARPSSLPHGSMCLVVIDPRNALHISACVNKTKYTIHVLLYHINSL